MVFQHPLGIELTASLGDLNFLSFLPNISYIILAPTNAEHCILLIYSVLNNGILTGSLYLKTTVKSILRCRYLDWYTKVCNC